MKKYIFPFFIILSMMSPQAFSSLDGKPFTLLNKPVSDAPLALYFFSFYCHFCYQYEEQMGMTEAIKQVLPEGIELTQYHSSFMGPLGNDLTHAWSVALLLNVADRVKPLFFDALQNKKSINSAEDIRRLFLSAGVTGAEYDAAWNSFAVKSMTQKQNQMANAFALTGIPAMYIDGKYQINPEGLNRTDVSTFVKSYADTVSELLNNNVR